MSRAAPTDFPPIAIVGQSCTLPSALNPRELWSAVLEGRDLLSRAPEGRWGIDPERILAARPELALDRTWSDRGGYVQGFASVWDPLGFEVPPEQILDLDPLFHWVLHGAREALWDAGHGGLASGQRIGVVLGNLSFPSTSLARLAEATWLGDMSPHPAPAPLNRFMSGLPAHLVARALGLGAGAFCIDAACASSLYAIKLACDRLHDGLADMMLAGAVNRADDLFIHVGFAALRALSLTGRSRPFHREADGLVPAEGAAFVVLKRLSDAAAAGDHVLAVIRGIGLSNDGRGAGLLAPSEEGQRRAMRRAYASSGLAPSEISLIECHATGTAVGDATEIRSTAAVFEGLEDVPIGSLKSNLGHLITVAGLAGLIKVVEAMRTGLRPPTLHAEDPLDAIAGSPFRLLTAPEPWVCGGPRRAAVSAFGFGGNNAHLLVEEWAPASQAAPVSSAGPALPEVDGALAIVGLGAVVADGSDAADFARDLFSGRSRLRPLPDGTLAGHAETVTLEPGGLRFPPRDLEQALPQQLLVLKAAGEAISEAGRLPRDGTAVLVGMGCDPEVARYGARWRVSQWAPSWVAGGPGAAEAWVARARDAFSRPLEAAGVLGTMPNVCANRLNSQFDLAGPSLSVSAEELSGVVALELAARALRSGEIDAAVVGAVDASSEPVHAAAALAALDPERWTPGDAAVVLVVKRLADARRDGDRVHAVLPETPAAEAGLRLGLAEGARSLTPLFGHAHAASGLLHVAAAALACRHGALPPTGGSGAASPWLVQDRLAAVPIQALQGPLATTWIGADPDTEAQPLLLEPPPRVHLFCGSDRRAVLRALDRGEAGGEGPARLAIVAGSEAELRERRARARALLEREGPGEGCLLEDGLAFRERPIGGELAFVFTGPAGAYAGMGRELLLGIPGLLRGLLRRSERIARAAAWIYADPPPEEPSPLEKLWGSSFLCQAHAELTRGRLGLRPQAVLGFCSGETNALFAMGAWSDLDSMVADTAEAQIYTRELAGSFDCVRRAWGEPPETEIHWANWRLLAPVDEVRSALEREPRAHLAILNAPGDCVVAGDAAACLRVVERVGPERARRLGYDIAVHCPEMKEFEQTWRRIHHRPTAAVPGVRFYTHATLSHYEPTADRAAEALLGQALGTVDFPRLVEKAWEDGVRVFLEHGPQGGCSRWIRKILGRRDHVAVALDEPGQSALRQAANAVAQLLAAGVPVSPDGLDGSIRSTAGAAAMRTNERDPSRVSSAPLLSYRVRAGWPSLPPLDDATATPVTSPSAGEGVAEAEPMAPAPWLPPPDDMEAGHRASEPSAAGAPPTAIAAARRAARPAHELVARVAEQHARLAQIHRDFITRQAEAHRLFLSLWQPSAASPGREAPAAPLVSEPAERDLPGPRFSRRDLEALASGEVSRLFGPLFRQQDGYRRQVRLPAPPLLLADRVLGIAGEAGSMGLGTIWTESDVEADSWYLHDGHMPAGVMIEAGQSDLLLISWLGVDFLNKGERVYRLLGCELRYHGGLPAPGDTLRYDIHVDGHARQDDVRLFFFHYDCRIRGETRLSVRQGQAGFFSDEELASSTGVLWEPDTAERSPRGHVDLPAVPAVPRRFTRDQVAAFSEGRVRECFGPGYEWAQTHLQTPRIPSGRMLLFHEVSELDPRGGPWKRGYLRARHRFSADDWFFQGHFKDDPCMPGTLMFEGCLQAMAFYLAALGYTLDKDGWRFEPVPDETYRLRCRGQATPRSSELVYELVVDEVFAGPEPTLYADLLCTVDGLRSFHCRRMGLKLVPDFPLSRRAHLLRRGSDPKPAAAIGPLRLDQDALLACAWGRPSEAMGASYAVFDGPRRLPRLPGPPYQFFSRVTSFSGRAGSARVGATVEAEYDIPASAWYFHAASGSRMPFCVLLEAHLQPCGWLALASGVPLSTGSSLHFRNLDGTATVARAVGPGDGTLQTRVRLAGFSASAGIYLLSFEVDSRIGSEPVLQMTTSFGFFPPEALATQVGLPMTQDERAWLERPGGGIDLAGFASGGMLSMIDRVSGYWPEAGRAGLGRLRGEKDVDPNAWFFKAHFFQDPVQPGSLGLQAMLQLLDVYLLERRLGVETARARCEEVARDGTITWKYRGQVLPSNTRVTVELEVLEAGRDERGAWAVADGWLSVDGNRIYQASGLAVRLAEPHG